MRALRKCHQCGQSTMDYLSYKGYSFCEEECLVDWATTAYQILKTAAEEYLNNTPKSELELAREAWGNTNTHCVLDARRALAAALEKLP